MANAKGPELQEEHIARDVVDGPKAVVADMQPRAVAPTAVCYLTILLS